MKRLIPAATLLAVLCVAFFAADAQTGSARPAGVPKGFFGVAPQTSLTKEDLEYMKAGGIESIRWPLSWGAVQPTRRSAYDWGSFDPIVADAARAGLYVLPSIGSPPRWAVRKGTTMPIDNATQRSG